MKRTRYYVINKETEQTVFFSGFRSDCEKFVNELVGKDNLIIVRKEIEY